LRTSTRAVGITERVSGGDAVAEAIPLGHRVLATRIHHVLVSFEDTCRAMRRLTPRPLWVREAWAVGAAVRTLRMHGDPLWEHPYWAPDFAGQLLRLRVRGWAALGWGGGRVMVDLPCPQCELRALCRFHGSDDYVRCLHCASWWDADGYQRLVVLLLEEEQHRAETGA
jgi:hypothetical protein